MPATLSNLEVFAIPPTQLAIDSSYEVSFRPSSTLDSAKTYDIQIPSSDDFTDLSETMLHVKLDIKDKDSKPVADTDVINVVSGFSCALFEQIDLYLNTVNVSQASGLYHYQAYLEDMLFRHNNKADSGAMWDDDEKNKARIKKPFDLYFKLHNPLCAQRNLLLNNIPILLRISRNSDSFGIIGTNTKQFKLKILDIAVHIKRVKVFPDVSLGIQEGLEKSPVNYFITINEVKSFVIPTTITTANFENVFSGVLPRRIGFRSC
uniref:Uncharacterized protein n=1 Tax=Tetranychus urticae TaxID=32264 RepID=A0A158P4A6_TETUR